MNHQFLLYSQNCLYGIGTIISVICLVAVIFYKQIYSRFIFERQVKKLTGVAKEIADCIDYMDIEKWDNSSSLSFRKISPINDKIIIDLYHKTVDFEIRDLMTRKELQIIETLIAENLEKTDILRKEKQKLDILKNRKQNVT